MSKKINAVKNNIATFVKAHKKLVGGGVVVLALGIGALIYNMNSLVPSEEVTLTPEFEDYQTKETQEAGVEAGIKIPGYSTIVFNYGESEAEVDFFNPEENNVYFQITLQLTEDETILYESKLIEPGQHLYSIELLEQLDQGEYDMTIVYSTYSMDENYTPRNGATVNCVLEVK